MVIKDIHMNDLVPLCVTLVSKTLVELGQSKDSKHIVVLSQSLANDLKEDFKNLTFEDVIQAFRQGVRNTDRFVLNVQTYYQWIKAQRKLIWDNTDKEPERLDKRLHYRSRQGTGLKQINNHLKSLKNG